TRGRSRPHRPGPRATRSAPLQASLQGMQGPATPTISWRPPSLCDARPVAGWTLLPAAFQAQLLALAQCIGRRPEAVGTRQRLQRTAMPLGDAAQGVALGHAVAAYLLRLGPRRLRGA